MDSLVVSLGQGERDRHRPLVRFNFAATADHAAPAAEVAAASDLVRESVRRRVREQCAALPSVARLALLRPQVAAARAAIGAAADRVRVAGARLASLERDAVENHLAEVEKATAEHAAALAAKKAAEAGLETLNRLTASAQADAEAAVRRAVHDVVEEERQSRADAVAGYREKVETAVRSAVAPLLGDWAEAVEAAATLFTSGAALATELARELTAGAEAGRAKN